MSSSSYGAPNETADVMLLVGQKRFYAHRGKLAEKSCYFQAMFSSDMKECREDIIELKGIGASSFDALIDYCYTNSCHVTEDNAYDLLRASSMYNFAEVSQSCIDFLANRLDTTNCLEIMVLADSLSIATLHLSAKQLALWDFNSVRHEREILELPVDILTDYLAQDDLRVDSEVDVFDAVATWIAHDQPNRANHFEELLQVVRFSEVDHQQIKRMWRSDSLGRCDCDCVVSRIRAILEAVWRTKSGRTGSLNQSESGSSEDCDPIASGNLLTDEINPSGDRCVEEKGGVSDTVDQNALDRRGSYDAKDESSEFDAPIDWDFVRSLLVASPRTVQLVPAVVANFTNGFTNESLAPCLAHYDLTAGEILYQDTITKAFQKSHTALGFRACIVGKHVYITGGEFNFGHNNWNFSIWKYDIFSKKWNFVTKLRNQRRHHILCVVDDCIYFIGGLGRFRVALNTAEKLDTVTERWSDIAALPDSIFSAVCTSHRNKIYVLQTNVYCYSIETDTWSQLKGVRLPNECNFHSALAHADGIYLLGSLSKNLIRFWPDDYEQNERVAAQQSMGQFRHSNNCACLIGDKIYAFNIEDMLAESYDIRTGQFRVVDTKNWSRTLGSANTCYGCFPMPKYAA